MAKLRISGNVRIGHIYECNFGLFKKNATEATPSKHEAVENDYNYRIPNEIIKKRAVVVIGKHRGQYIVVPISSTEETDKKPAKNPENKGFHVRLGLDDFPVTKHYLAEKIRWAKSNLVSTIDGGRLTDIYDSNIPANIPAHKVSDETLREIREGVIISIGMNDLLVDKGKP
ncbi:hypothetical protein CXF86_19770 (plasmid) [Shewanella sp. GutCb]|uniref:type II toxin-antitoxin system PemK/MazF family toxin n=1 Tax=Shewanella sp. GutCb TaxID=2058315 RepID=UPI000C7C76D2|nr:type II toxin-antitoxin system PemK/MazF family toxin [Shewanella sp. GutCb]PKG73036.1 hypothetical protein CXF86_19770 [Shewanella sp. GutCb]